MKKRRSLPLFEPLEPDVYEIDTSSLLNIDGRADAEETWALIIDLTKKGRIVICGPVLEELRDNPMYALRFKPYEKALQAGDRRNDAEYLQAVGKVTHDHPAMSRATGVRTPADPFVVALAELEKYVIVCDESRTKRPNRKIPGVCKKLGIRCITLIEFVAAVKSEKND
jgi:hypothetical protein